MPRLRWNRDCTAGLFFLFLGLFFAFFSQDLPMGTAARMASGYFPRLLGWLLALLGIAITIKGLLLGNTDHDDIYVFDFKRLSLLTLSVVSFALLLPSGGLVFALTISTLIALLASARPTLKEALCLSLAINAIVWAVFVWGIDITINLWPNFLGA